jgi:hypothetical protein
VEAVSDSRLGGGLLVEVDTAHRCAADDPLRRDRGSIYSACVVRDHLASKRILTIIDTSV